MMSESDAVVMKALMAVCYLAGAMVATVISASLTLQAAMAINLLLFLLFTVIIFAKAE